MNDSMLMQATSRQGELTREIGHARFAARTKMTANAKTQGKKRSSRPASRLAAAIARLRPAAAGRWQAQ